MDKLLTADIGNTNINIAVFSNGRMSKRTCVSSKMPCYERFLKSLDPGKTTGVIICSVVPKAEKVFAASIRNVLACKPFICGKNVTVPIRNLYKRPEQVGQDRLVNAFAAGNLYGKPAIVVDFGTAVTFDLLSKNGSYLGGVILPGLKTSLESLYEKTALLPKTSLKAPRALYGKNTQDSIVSGIVYGFSCLTDGMTKKLANSLGGKPKIIATGGGAHFISRYCRNIKTVDPDLTLKGLNLIYQTIA